MTFSFPFLLPGTQVITLVVDVPVITEGEMLLKQAKGKTTDHITYVDIQCATLTANRHVTHIKWSCKGVDTQCDYR